MHSSFRPTLVRSLAFLVITVFQLQGIDASTCESPCTVAPPVVNVYAGTDGGNETCKDAMLTLKAMLGKQEDLIHALLARLGKVEDIVSRTPAAICKDKEWTLVFKGVAGLQTQSLVELWVGNSTSNKDVVEAQQLTSTFRGHFKSDLANNWQPDIKKVKFAFIENGKEVMTLIFNGVNSNKLNWFSKDRLISTPYTDMLTSNYNYFDINKNKKRTWLINKLYGGCAKDVGWVVVDRYSAPSGCPWDLNFGSVPDRFMYSPTDTAFIWQSGQPATASVMAIFIQ